MPANELEGALLSEVDPNATLLRAPGHQAEIVSQSGIVAILPGFVIESTLGRGAFGVVYKARQVGLNRTVALKMLIGGPFADPGLRARFLLEAESVAALEHPGIVRVFAFGEHGGHPYLAMEYVPGGTLADRVKKDGPLPAKAATELVAKLAEAVAHAHSRGVVHRDIKPLNVLLTAGGEPRLTDFGLAKVGRADQNLSVTGQILGTPAYMAPEQAAGKVHEVGTAADVYALGAVLYDVLTGRPPFQGDSAAVTLQKVISEEPERPRKLNASIPRDLETICLKCLEKSPARRYPTAQALADDLQRYLRNEPISARPAGTLERGYKWVKRNKGVAGTIATVSLALLAGAGVSLGFGLDARKQKKEAENAAGREKIAAGQAADEKQVAIAARNALKIKNDELIRSREQTNRTLARALLNPITAKNRNGLLTPYEVETFWQITELRRDEVSWMFLEEATRTPLACEQLDCRAEYTLHAVTGLDPARRDAADQLLLARLREATTQGRKARSLARVISQSRCASPEAAAIAFGTLTEAFAKEPESFARGILAEGLAGMAARMEPAEAAKACPRAFAILAAALAREADSFACGRLAVSLAALAKRMEVTQAFGTLTEAFANEPESFARGNLAEGLASVAARAETAQAAEVCAQAAGILSEALAKETDSFARGRLAESLALVASRMEPAPAAKVCARVLNTLAEALAKEASPVARGSLAVSLGPVAARMEPAEAAKVCARVAGTLAETLARETDPGAHGRLVLGLAAMAARMEPAEAAKVCARVAGTLTEALAREKNTFTRGNLSASLKLVATRMGLAQAVKLLTDALANETSPFALGIFAEGLALVAARMEPAEAARVCTHAASILTNALAKETSPFPRARLVLGLAAVAARMEPAPAVKLLTEALAQETNSSARGILAEGLALVAARMEPAEAANVCTRAASVLTDSLTRETDAAARGGLAEGLALVAVRMEPAQAARLLADLLAQETTPFARGRLAESLALVAARMEPAEAAKVCFQAADILTDALTQEADSYARGSLAKGLASVTFGVPINARGRSQRTIVLAAASATQNALPSLALLHPHFHPQPRPLPPEELVELLKHPFCVAEARRAVLDALEFTYERKFADQWEFAEYARKHQPQLDLLTPPRRPPQP